MVGTGIAARHGILIKDAEALELAHAVRAVAFDKTGTLTEGRPVLAHLGGTASADELLAAAAALQRGSEHPLARAVLDEAARRGIAPAPATDLSALRGRGIRGAIGGQVMHLGSGRLMQELGVDTTPLAAEARAREERGETVSWLARGREAAGILTFRDPPKPTAAAAVARLRALGVRTLMLTGDGAGAARAVAAEVGIDEFRAEVLPEDKARAVAELRTQAGQVAMVGDGVNDAPALAAADVGIAMGSGTDVAMQAAGVTLMRGDPRLVADAIDVSRRTYAKIRQNLFWAFIYNVIGIPLAALGWLSPVIAGVAMAFSSVSVVTNALTLRRWKGAAS
jgi:Cu+-exporting ATPase